MNSTSATALRTDDFDTATGSTRTFLLVDDSKVIRRRLVSLLSEIDGVSLAGEASDAIEGAEMIRALHPDVVILDIRMPNRSGIGLLESIKDSADLPTLIVLTNYPYAAYRKRCIELGASHFFDKSSEFDRLEAVVRELAEANR